MVQWGKYSLRMYKFQKYCYDKLLKEADSKGGTIENVWLYGAYIKELPEFFRDLTVIGSLTLDRNLLTSCKNFPKVKNELSINDNNISNLEGLQNIPRILSIEGNKLTSLEYFSRFAGSKSTTIYATNNEIASMKGLENIELERLIIYSNKLSSWDYAPIKLMELRVNNNKLKSWEGMPSGLMSLSAALNWDIKNMNGFKRVRAELYMSSSTLTVRDIRRELEGKEINPPNYIYITNE